MTILVGEREKDPALPRELHLYLPLSSVCVCGTYRNILPIPDWSVPVLLYYEYTMKEKQNAVHSIRATNGT